MQLLRFYFLITNSSLILGSGPNPDLVSVPAKLSVQDQKWFRSSVPAMVYFWSPALVLVPVPVKISGPITQWH